MAFWSDTNLDPKRQFKFYVTFSGLLATAAPHWVVKAVNKPTFTVGETAVKYLDKNYYFPGRTDWNTVKFTMVDPASPDGVDVSTTLINIIKLSGYQWPVAQPNPSPANMTTISKNSSNLSLGGVTFKQINSNGLTLETWELKNAWIKSVNFGALSYESEDLVNLEMELRYDYANLF